MNSVSPRLQRRVKEKRKPDTGRGAPRAPQLARGKGAAAGLPWDEPRPTPGRLPTWPAGAPASPHPPPDLCGPGTQLGALWAHPALRSPRSGPRLSLLTPGIAGGTGAASRPQSPGGSKGPRLRVRAGTHARGGRSAAAARVARLPAGSGAARGAESPSARVTQLVWPMSAAPRGAPHQSDARRPVHATKGGGRKGARE